MNVKIINKYKKKSVPQLRKTAGEYFRKYIRLRDCDEYGNATCISSDKPLKYGTQNCQAGHFVAVGYCPALEFNEDNVHVQSKQDNYFKSGNPLEYRKNLIKKIGLDRVEKIEELRDMYKRTGFKHDRFSLIETIETYKAKVQKIRTEKMFEVK